MAVITFGGQKGGSGKSTLAANIAAQRTGEGRKVLLVDCDPQMSLVKWAQRRKLAKIEPRISCISLYGETVNEEISDQIDNYDDIIVDTHGGMTPELASALLVSDKLITPAQTSQFEIDTFLEMDRLIPKVRALNRKLKALVVINSAPTSSMSRRAKDAKAALESLQNYSVLDHVIRRLAAFEDTAADGMGVTEYQKRDTRAVSDLLLFADEVWA